MADLLMVMVIVVCIAACVAYVGLCDRLVRRDDDSFASSTSATPRQEEALQ